MTDRHVFELQSPMQGWKQFQIAWQWAKPYLLAGHRMFLEIKPATRSVKANAMLHAILTHVSENIEWAGKKRDTETWKRLMVAAWCRARNEQVEILPAIDGHGIDIVFRKTSKLTIAECSDLIEFIFAWAAMNDLQIPERLELKGQET